MNWYYGANGETIGPVDENQMIELINQGTVVSNTLVWNDQMGDAWITVAESELKSYLGGGAPAAPADGLNMAVAEGGGFCSLCGNQFPATDLVEIGDMSSCAACKPMALRRIQQNTFSGALHYAGFWMRVLAWIIDNVIKTVVGSIIGGIIGFIIGLTMASSKSNPVTAVIILYSIVICLNIAIVIFYDIYLICKMGGTPGMRACGIVVVNADGTGPISGLKATGRFFANLLNSFTFLIGYIIIAFDDEKRALHDHICSTRVVYLNR